MTKKVNKSKKRDKHFKKNFFKSLMSLIIFQIIIVLIFMYFYTNNVTITDKNSIIVTGEPKDVEILDLHNATHLYFSINSEQFHISSDTDKDHIELWIEQFKQEEEVTVIAKSSKKILSNHRYAVDLRSDNFVYADIEDYNKFMGVNRILAYIMIFIVWLIGTVVSLFKLIIIFLIT